MPMLRKENRTGDDHDDDDAEDGYDHDDDDDGGGDDDDDHEGDDHDDDDYHYGDLPASAVTVRCERSETVKSAPSAASTRS